MDKLKLFSYHKIFFLLVLIIIFSQIILLSPVIGQGLTNEDYLGFFKVRLYKDQMFSDPLKVWTQVGIHDAAHDFYIGFLNIFFGEDYTMYLYTSIFFKIIATLLLYPLIFIISKNRLLAFLATFIYGISYPSVGALYLYVVGNEYLGLAFLNLFLIMYCLCIRKTNLRSLVFSSLFIFLAYLTSPIRTYPIFVIVFFIELFLLARNKFSSLLVSLYRLIAVFSPFVLITILGLKNSGSGVYSLAGLPDFVRLIINGNWYLLLNPLWGLGYLFLPVYYLPILGKIDIQSLLFYLGSLMRAQLMIFLPITVFLSFFLSKNKFRFSFILTITNLLFETFIYFLYTHHFYIVSNLVQEYGSSFLGGLYAGIIGAYVIAIAVTCLTEWVLTEKKDTLLFLIFISPFIALFFILSQWIFTRQYYMYQEGIHRYFVLPAFGASLFIASLITVIFQKKTRLRPLTNLMMIIFLITIFVISKNEINQLFTGKKNSGQDLKIQENVQLQALSYIPKERINNDLLVLMKFASNIPAAGNRWEDTFDWRNFTFWMHIRRSYLANSSIFGCIVMIWDESELQKMATVQNESRGFLYKDTGGKEMRCVRNGQGYSLDGKFVKLDNLFAFAVDDRLQVLSVTDDVKKRLIFH